MKLRLFLLSALLLAACSHVRKTEPNVKEADFGIPQDLANRFAVSDAQAPAIPIIPGAGKETKELPTKIETTPPKVNPADVQAVKKVKLPKVKKRKGEVPAAPKGTLSDSFPVRLKETPPFHTGERHVFDVTYFGTTAGSVQLHVLPNKFIGEREVFNFKGYAQSTSIFALFYRLNDAIESFMDAKGLFSQKFVLKLDESLQQRDMLELYDQKQHKVHYWSKLEHKNKGNSSEQFTGDIEPFTQDVLSAIFYLRTLPLEVGKTFSFPVVSNGKPWTVEAHVTGHEDLVTKAGKFPAFIIKPDTKFEGILKTTGDCFIWISDDAHRSILKIDAKVKIGSVIAYLRELDYGQP